MDSRSTEDERMMQMENADAGGGLGGSVACTEYGVL